MDNTLKAAEPAKVDYLEKGELERRAEHVARVAVETIDEQYRGGPIGRNIALTAARMALGLQSIPEQAIQGEK